MLAAHPLRDLLTVEGPYPFYVDRQRALFSSWYEFFPRSEGARAGRRPARSSAAPCAPPPQRLPAVAAMGFDVIYLPPIHPIGEVNRKGANNTLTPAPDDVGLAVGDRQQATAATTPSTPTSAPRRLRRLRRRGPSGSGSRWRSTSRCRPRPDHPWATEHPEWFTTRADGTIAYAENPPKKYQDIYPINFDNDPEGIYAEVPAARAATGCRTACGSSASTTRTPSRSRSGSGCSAEIRETDPDVLFLAEAFTRPRDDARARRGRLPPELHLLHLAHEPWELEEYLTELSHETAHLMRPNFFVNTPDILHAFLQYGGPPAFKIRAALAATGSPSWGVYAGYELFEHVAVEPGSEEYLDSEKYQIRIRDWDAAPRPRARRSRRTSRRLNEVRRAHPALQQLRNVAVHCSDDDARARVTPSSDAGRATTWSSWWSTSTRTRRTPPRCTSTCPRSGCDWDDSFTVTRRDHRPDLALGRAQLRAPRPLRRTRPRLSRQEDTTIDVPTASTASSDQSATNRDWFKTAVFYEVLVRSFKDSNGDGVGDFRGLTEKLDYLQWLGVDCLWVPPFFSSPLRDGGYDVADYTNILPECRHRRGLPPLPRRGAQARHPRDHRLRHEPHQRRAPVVPGQPRGPRRALRRLLRLVRHRRALRRRADHLRRHRAVQLDLGPRAPAVLLAPVLLPPARPQLRQPEGAWRRCWRRWRSGSTWASTASGSTPCPTSTSVPAPTARTCPRPTRSLKTVRRFVDDNYPGRVLLCEANQWPADVVEYFGDPRRSAATSATWPSTSR